MPSKKTYYIYSHIDLNTGETFYIGKGTGNRGYTNENRSPQWNKKVSELNHQFEVKILERNLTKQEAEEAEYQYIKKFGKIEDGTGILVNVADGVFGLREEIDLQEMAIEALEQNMGDPNFVKNLEDMSEMFNKMRYELGMSEEEIEEWYHNEIHNPTTKEMNEEEGIAECEECGFSWDIEELIDEKYCPECKNNLR